MINSWLAFRLEMGPLSLWPGKEPGRNYRVPAILFFSSLLLRLAFLFQNGPLLLPDSWGRYLRIASALFGQWTGTVYDTPGYPMFIAVILAATGSDMAVYVVQAVMDGLTVCMIWSIARELGMNRGALYLASFFVVYPASILFACSALSETMFTFLIICSVWLFTGLNQKRIWARCIGMGLLLGFASITRANGILVLLVFCGVVFLSYRSVRWWRPVLALAMGALPCILPWIFFNARTRNIVGIAQGGGWQSLQNLAYFDLVEPETLPQGTGPLYDGFSSLTRIRAEIEKTGEYAPEEIDPLLKGIARENIKRNFWGYLKAMPVAYTMPRAFIKDLAKIAVMPGRWEISAALARENGFDLMKPLQTNAPINIFLRVLRPLTIFRAKYALLGLALPFALWHAIRRRNAILALLCSVPFSHLAVLTLMLNPIERYYFPFEPMMILGFIVALSLWFHRGNRQSGRENGTNHGER